jgi:hypothetical protein
MDGALAAVDPLRNFVEYSFGFNNRGFVGFIRVCDYSK